MDTGRFQTKISKHNYDWISRQDLSPGELIQFLESGALYRTFSDVLKKVYQKENLTDRLAKGLVEITGIEYANVCRKIRNWMCGEHMPKNREQLFQICFVLGLGEADADRLIASASDNGIHYRNPREIVYAFALRTGKTYGEAFLLHKKMQPVYEEQAKKGNQLEKIYTVQLRDQFTDIRTEEELEDFFVDFGGCLGELHETAYKKFMEMLGHLQRPEEGDKRYSVKNIVDEFIRMHVPNTKNTKGLTYLQKVIKKNWPSESEIFKMKNRKTDVNRKTLLLLFLITEDFADDLYDENMDGESPTDRLEIRLNRINWFLDNYGMNLLDPGSAFDCLVLYALRMQCGDEDEILSKSVESALAFLFEKSEDNHPCDISGN